ncbi:hypothetical protein DRW03_31585 [Corallococcus sp. H22C18031201]|nr:hypothetical protein DRW03_31585 [Corallococcus sp. H22C18031201]
MGGGRNGNGAGMPESAAAEQPALRAGAYAGGFAREVDAAVARLCNDAASLLREGHAARAFGELARASRTLPMTPRLAAALVRFSLRAGTEAAAITLLETAARTGSEAVRPEARRQLARVLRRVDQPSRAVSALEALLSESPDDDRARFVLMTVRERMEGTPQRVSRKERLGDEGSDEGEPAGSLPDGSTVEVGTPSTVLPREGLEPIILNAEESALRCESESRSEPSSIEALPPAPREGMVLVPSSAQGEPDAPQLAATEDAGIERMARVGADPNASTSAEVPPAEAGLEARGDSEPRATLVMPAVGFAPAELVSHQVDPSGEVTPEPSGHEPAVDGRVEAREPASASVAESQEASFEPRADVASVLSAPAADLTQAPSLGTSDTAQAIPAEGVGEALLPRTKSSVEPSSRSPLRAVPPDGGAPSEGTARGAEASAPSPSASPVETVASTPAQAVPVAAAASPEGDAGSVGASASPRAASVVTPAVDAATSARGDGATSSTRPTGAAAKAPLARTASSSAIPQSTASRATPLAPSSVPTGRAAARSTASSDSRPTIMMPAVSFEALEGAKTRSSSAAQDTGTSPESTTSASWDRARAETVEVPLVGLPLEATKVDAPKFPWEDDGPGKAAPASGRERSPAETSPVATSGPRRSDTVLVPALGGDALAFEPAAKRAEEDSSSSARPAAKRPEDAGSPGVSTKRSEDVSSSGAVPKRSDTVLVPALGAESPVSGSGASPKRSDTVLVPALSLEALLGTATAGPKRTDTVQPPASGDAAGASPPATNKSKRSEAVWGPATVRGAPPDDELPTAESVPPVPMETGASVARSPGGGPPRGEPSRERPSPASGLAQGEGQRSTEPPEASHVPRPVSAEDAAELARSQRMEAQLIAKRSWRELAQLYLKRAEQAKEPQARAEVLTRLAEVMETELKDSVGAARVYREIVELTGDRDALREQIRLLTQRGDASVVRRALDEAILNARTPRARASALLTRGERWLHLAELGKARRDFHAAEAIAPGLLPVLAGLVRCVADSERPAIAERLKQACIGAPRRTVDRLDALKVLASTAENVLGDLRLAQWAWAEALSESPEHAQARERLVVLARRLGDLASLGYLLRSQLTREPRGLAAREARLELVSTLESAGDSEAALTELRQAVRFEPGHKDAWLMLSDRLSARGQLGEAAWALENAATAMEDEEERERAWQRLAVFCREVLRNPERAEQYARRAENMRLAREESAPPPPEPPRSATPKREPSGSRSVLVAPPVTVSLTPAGSTDLSDETTSNTDFDLEGVPGGVSGRGTSSESAPPAKGAARSAPSAPKSASKSAPVEAAPSKGVPAPKSAVEPAASKRAPGAKPAPAEAAASKSAPADGAAAKSTPASKSAPVDAAASKSTPASKSAPASKAAPVESAASKNVPVLPDSASPKSAKGADAAVSSAKGVKDASAAPKSEPAVAQNRGAKSRSLIDDGEDLRPDAINATQVIGWEAPPGRMDPVRRLHRPRSEGTVAGPAPSRPPEPAAKPPVGTAETRESVATAEPEPATSEPAVFRLVREQPLDPKPYRGLVEHFESRGDVARASLMQETADALEGKESPAPRGLRAPLSGDERAGLRHPGLRTPSGELLACAGLALCRLFPTQGRTAGVTEPLRSSSGPGAPAILDTLHTVARMMDVPLPELVLAEDDGPPFTVVYTTAPRLVVGREGVRQAMPAAELRFHAGRALFSLSPDLLALRTLKEMQLLRALALLSSVLKDPRATSDEARIVREALSPRALERAAALMDAGTRDFKASTLMDAARDSVNRAGLVACGGVGPALAALRARRVREPELTELLRFAASERYLSLRSSPERSGR